MLRSVIGSLKDHAPSLNNYQADILVSDYRRHTTYRPLLSRTTCGSLEDRKEHFAKRRKLNKFLNSTELVKEDN